MDSLKVLIEQLHTVDLRLSYLKVLTITGNRYGTIIYPDDTYISTCLSLSLSLTYTHTHTHTNTAFIKLF